MTDIIHPVDEPCYHRTWKREFAAGLMGVNLLIFGVAIWAALVGNMPAFDAIDGIGRFLFPFTSSLSALAFGADWFARQSPWSTPSASAPSPAR